MGYADVDAGVDVNAKAIDTGKSVIVKLVTRPR